MKNYLLIITAAAMFFSSITLSYAGEAKSVINPREAIVGVWQGYNRQFNGTIRFSFDQKGTGKFMEVTGNGTTIGNIIPIRYSIDTSVTPIAFDFHMIPQNATGYAIIKFLSTDEMKFKMANDSSKRSRPRSFSVQDDSEAVVFKRVK